MNRLPHPGTRGMTLIELMIAMTIFSIVLGAAFGLLSRQSQAYRIGTERMEVLQNLRFAGNTLNTDLRVAGANLPDQQPQFVYAGADVVAFNADYASNVAGDAWSVYYDPDAPAGMVTAMRASQRKAIPGTTFQYPDADYEIAGANSPAELLVFFFTPDSLTTRSDDFMLYRQVNAQPPELVARNLLPTPGVPFFTYYRLRTPTTGQARIEQVATSELPLIHRAPFHLSPADTGASARTDSLRGVRVNFTATNGLTGTAERQQAFSRLVRFPNAGMGTRRTCGDDPILGTGLTATAVVLASGEPAVRLVWNAAIDETAGEKDVVRYVLWRRISGSPEWGDPYRGVPAGNAPYMWDDQFVQPGVPYDYALAAQDCTPTQSTLAMAGPVVP